MPRFATRQLERPVQTADLLVAARERRYLSLSQVAKKLGVPLPYLTALENGDWDVLPAGDYGRYFLKRYAAFLGLPVDTLVAEYPGQSGPSLVQPARHPVQASATLAVHPLRRLLYLGAAASVLLYLVFAAWATLVPPTLSLVSPAADLTTSSTQVPVSGSTKPGTTIAINGASVDVAEDGSFSASVPLQVGLNTITVTAERSYRRPVTITRRVRFILPVSSAPVANPIP